MDFKVFVVPSYVQTTLSPTLKVLTLAVPTFKDHSWLLFMSLTLMLVGSMATSWPVTLLPVVAVAVVPVVAGVVAGLAVVAAGVAGLAGAAAVSVAGVAGLATAAGLAAAVSVVGVVVPVAMALATNPNTATAATVLISFFICSPPFI